MAGRIGKSGEVVPLTVQQILELLESTTTDPPVTSAAAVLCRVETLLLRETRATSVDAFLVDHWFNKLLHFSAAAERDGDGTEGAAATARLSERGSSSGEDGGTEGSEDQPSPHQTVFHTRAVCDIGEGVAGMAAMTGRKLRIRDCRAHKGKRPESSAYGTHHDNGSLICWPVRERTFPRDATVTTSRCRGSTEDPPPVTQLEDVEAGADYGYEPAAAAAGSNSAGEGGRDGGGEGVLAVLQLHCAEGFLSEEAVGVLHTVGQLLVPLLTHALARDKEYVRGRSTEALLSLSSIVPREMGLITMIEEVVRVAQMLTEAERVCFFFVDDAADELWVAKSVDFDDAKIKIGEGLCGYAAATAGTVNVIDSYQDSRFDRKWDKQTGFVTKSVLCVPIPPPDHAPEHGNFSAALAAASGGLGGDCSGGQDGGNCSSRGDGRLGSRTDSVDLPTPVSAAAVDGSQSPKVRRRRSSQLPPRPLAVLEVINKRGKGIFGQHDEAALVRLCAGVESLLRRKAAEVSLLWSGMTERSLIRNGTGPGGPSGATNYARVESTIMRLYSKVSFPADALAVGEKRARRKNSAALHGGGGGGSVRDRAASDSFCTTVGDERRSSNGGDLSSVRRRGGSDSSVSGKAARAHGVGGGGIGGGCLDGKLMEETAQEESELVDLGMNLFDLSSDKLLSLVGRFFRNMRLTELFQISDQKLGSFVRGVEKRYNPHPFHNLIHAVSVTHASFAIIKTTQVNSLLRPLDKLALLVAAFCHDIDHPGNNNDYEVNSLSPLALQHGDSSVLERHHVFVAYQVILQEGGANNIFSELTRAQFRDARQTIVKAIIGTDMSSHMQHCADLFQFAQKAKRLRAGGGRGAAEGAAAAAAAAGAAAANQGGNLPPHKRPKSGAVAPGEAPRGGRGGITALSTPLPQPPAPPLLPSPAHIFSVDRAEDRSFLTQTIVHCADLSGQMLDTPLALEWGRRILEEFRLQAALEATAGLPLTTVASGDMETTMKGQHFFAAKIVKPLWEPFVGLFPELSPLLENLNNNCDYYFQEGQRLEEQRLSTAVPATPSSTDDVTTEAGGGMTEKA
eukprot:g1789.t1